MSPDSTASRRPWQLDNRDWLARRYLSAGDNAIAAELGVSPGSVIRARKRLKIASQPLGRRRGVAVENSTHKRAADLISDRIASEQAATGPAPSLHLVATRVRALHDANVHGDRRDLSEALVSLAASCGLVVDHIARVEQC